MRIVSSGTGGAIGQAWLDHDNDDEQGNFKTVSSKGYVPGKTIGWRPSCRCDAGPPVPCTVLDPFCGSGTSGIVTVKNGRNFIGVDLSEEYCVKIALPRLKKAEMNRGFGLSI